MGTAAELAATSTSEPARRSDQSTGEREDGSPLTGSGKMRLGRWQYMEKENYWSD